MTTKAVREGTPSICANVGSDVPGRMPSTRDVECVDARERTTSPNCAQHQRVRVVYREPPRARDGEVTAAGQAGNRRPIEADCLELAARDDAVPGGEQTVNILHADRSAGSLAGRVGRGRSLWTGRVTHRVWRDGVQIAQIVGGSEICACQRLFVQSAHAGHNPHAPGTPARAGRLSALTQSQGCAASPTRQSHTRQHHRG